MAATMTSSSASQTGEKTQLPHLQLISSHFTECSTLMKSNIKEYDNYVLQTLNNDSNNSFFDSRFLRYRFCAPKAIFCQSVSVCQQLASFLQTLFNSPFLSSEAKSLSLTLTEGKKKSKAPHHLKRRMTPVLFNFSLIHRRNGTHA